jgi:hypothetical protein
MILAEHVEILDLQSENFDEIFLSNWAAYSKVFTDERSFSKILI